MKNLFLILHLSIFSLTINAQVSESCNCLVDTLGYSTFIQSLNPNESADFQFHVNGTFAVAYGVINGETPAVVQDLIDNYPTVTTIIMHSCPGSDNDEANLQASMLIHNHGYKMYLPKNGFIASGATDMFLAGSIRVVEVTYDPVGVHSWSDGTNQATDFPVGHEYHQPYIDYYVIIGFTLQEAENFYYFTINAAAANDVHWMSESELDQYKIRTCKYSETPIYSVTVNENVLTADLDDVTYQWIDCADNSVIEGETNQSFTASNNGNYAVIINESTCEDTSVCYSINNVGMLEKNLSSQCIVYPNPFNESFTVDLGDETSGTIRITDLTRREVYNDLFNHKKILKINFEALSGFYLIRIDAKDEIALIRLIKE